MKKEENRVLSINAQALGRARGRVSIGRIKSVALFLSLLDFQWGIPIGSFTTNW
jgi:hypothetical protein